MPSSSHKLRVRDYSESGARLDRLSAAYFSQVPFNTILSLDPLIEYWDDRLRQDDKIAELLQPSIVEYLRKHPELRGPIANLEELRRHKHFLRFIAEPLFAQAYDDDQPAAVIVPFEYRVVHSVSAFDRLFMQDGDVISGHVNLDLRTLAFGKTVAAYLHILRSVYGIDVPLDYPVTFTTQDSQTGLDLHYKVATDLRFVQVRTRGDVPELSKEIVRSLLAKVADLSEWMRIIPPSSFEFYGFSIIRAHDITHERMMATLHADLLEEGNLISRSVLPDIEDHIRTLLRIPFVELGLAVIDRDSLYLLNEPEQPLVNTFFSRSRRYDLSVLENSLFERCLAEGAFQVIEDLEKKEPRAQIEDDMLAWGVRNLVASPLIVRGEQVGLFYLWSYEPASLFAIDVLKFLELLPVFAVAVRRVREDMRSRVQHVIMGQYTAIHPSVEWRFRRAALSSIQKEERGESLEVEPIVFEDLYPLFAATDIRSSSEHRNEAIRKDLLDHLDLARDILSKARDTQPVAVFHHLLARIDRYQLALQNGLASSDEAAVRDFLQHDLDPMLVSLGQMSEGLERAVQGYRSSVDQADGTLYGRSRAFESSVQQINATISDFLESEQQKLQSVLPHYFEKHQTDGVDFTIYVGASLLEDREYDPIYVNVLRLWQLMALCGIATRARTLRDALEVPLETTHLVLVQNTPINIRYRFDETRFDVDGPHHVRFEIMKQRVEKANVRGTNERLTQPDRIAIVYSQDREAEEYFEYLGYLRDEGFISADIESLYVDDLQGMKGLRALRVEIAVDSTDELPPIEADALRDAVAGMDLGD